jgi:membrane protein
VTSAAEDRPEGGTAPEGPERLTLADWIDVVKRAFKEFMSDGCMDLAKQIAFSSTLAFFPAIAFLLGVLGLFNLFDDVKKFLDPIAPAGVVKFITGLQKDSKSDTGATIALIVGFFGATWAASGAMGTVVNAVNRAYDRIESRPFWKVRLVSIVLVILSGLVTAAMFLLVVFGGPLGNAIAKKAHAGGAFDLLWAILRWPIAFVAVLLFFSLIYYLAPDVPRRNWKWVTPGSLVGGILWLALSGLFAVYATLSGSYTKTYGSLAAGIILLLWLNYTAWAILFGAELNSELDRQADIDAAGGPQAGLVKPARRTA